jgi:hypothetical protein
MAPAASGFRIKHFPIASTEFNATSSRGAALVACVCGHDFASRIR